MPPVSATRPGAGRLGGGGSAGAGVLAESEQVIQRHVAEEVGQGGEDRGVDALAIFEGAGGGEADAHINGHAFAGQAEGAAAGFDAGAEDLVAGGAGFGPHAGTEHMNSYSSLYFTISAERHGHAYRPVFTSYNKGTYKYTTMLAYFSSLFLLDNRYFFSLSML